MAHMDPNLPVPVLPFSHQGLQPGPNFGEMPFLLGRHLVTTSPKNPQISPGHCLHYPLVIHQLYGYIHHHKWSINGPCSKAMLNNQRVRCLDTDSSRIGPGGLFTTATIRSDPQSNHQHQNDAQMAIGNRL